MADVENPNGLVLLVDLVKNPINPAALTEKTANISMGLLGFSGDGATIWKPFERIQRVDEFFEPLGPTNGSPFHHPVIDAVGIGFRRVSEDDLVGHASSGTLVQILSGASLGLLPRRPGRV